VNLQAFWFPWLFATSTDNKQLVKVHVKNESDQWDIRGCILSGNNYGQRLLLDAISLNI
jgi:hypothetical protein